MGGERRAGALAVPQVALAALFVTALVTAQVTAAKVVAFGLPAALPLAGNRLLVPAAVFAYAVTFFASDCYAELYGRRAAQVLVNVAFVMNFVLLGLVWLAIAAPTFQGSPVAGGAFADVLGASTGVVAGSLAAYLVSQNWDVLVFDRLRGATGGAHLWLRNVTSTATSQFLDTVVFVTVAFLLFQGLPPGQVLGLLVGQYVVKLLIAVLDTPFVYAVVGVVRSREGDGAVPVGGD
jgi:uncharacterized integral membrane protein (TIGR00697 family)